MMNWKTKNILVVDDIKINYAVLRGMLKPTQANILWAKNFTEALDHFKTNDIDLILMDFQMPEMNGLEMSKLLKKENEKLPIIFQTANSSNLKAEGNNNYYEDILEKPINRYKLLYTIDKYIK